MSRDGFLLLLLVLCVCRATFSEGGDEVLSMPVSGNVSLDPVIEFLGPLQTLTVSQLPAQGPVRKVLVIFVPRHDEGAGPEVFWDYGPNCPMCTGMPESRSIVIDALTRNYAVLALVSITAPDGDWTKQAWPADSPDLDNAELLITEWKKKYGLEDTPTVGIGISAGGNGLSSLALRPGIFEAITIMISQGREEAWSFATEEYPPTMFANMPKDEETVKCIAVAKSRLLAKGVPIKHVEWYEKPLTPDWFEQKIPGVDLQLSRAIVQAFRDGGFMVGSSDFLRDESIDLSWRPALKSILPDDPLRNGKMMFENSIYQEMKVAIAVHSTFSRMDDEIFDWYDGAIRMSVKLSRRMPLFGTHKTPTTVI